VHGEKAQTRKRSRREQGQALLEFALVVPIFLVLAFGIADFGWALKSWITITDASEEGAQLGAVGADCDAIVQRVVRTSDELLTPADVSVENCQGDPGTSVVVTVDYEYSFVTPLSGLLGIMSGGAFPDTLHMTSSTSMRLDPDSALPTAALVK
jgi:Flp pilus assembly protein TadG